METVSQNMDLGFPEEDEEHHHDGQICLGVVFFLTFYFTKSMLSFILHVNFCLSSQLD